MSVKLCMDPQTPPLTWEEFCKRSSSFSISLDGYVKESPKFDPSGPRVNFNHHEGVSRLEMRATCGQVLMAIRQGLFDCFRDKNGVRADVYVNDCDEDVCTAWFLLKHPHLVIGSTHTLLNRLVSMEDALDTTAGAYPYPKDLPALRELAWVFEPYRRIRLNGDLERKDAKLFEGVVTDVEHRISAHIVGKGSEIPVDMRYERIGGGNGWTMIREIGAQGRTGAFADGIRAYVAVRERPSGGYAYTVGRMSPFIPFDVPKILQRLSDFEDQMTEQWGGGDMIGGSPRVAGTKLLPKEVERIVNEVIDR